MPRLKATPPLMLLMKDISLLEHDAQAQYKFNRFWALLWGAVIFSLPFFPVLYGHQVSALLIQEIALWANFSTHFSAMSSALVAVTTGKAVADVASAIAAGTPELDKPSSSDA